MDTIRIGLYEPVQAHKALQSLWPIIKPQVIAGNRLNLELRGEKRSDPQNRKLHACLGDIAKQIKWAGKRRDIDTWKRLLTAAWLRARGEHVEFLPALDGHGVDVVFRRTSDLTRPECAELLEYVLAWGATAGVNWSYQDA